MTGCPSWEWGLCAGIGCPMCNQLYCGCCGNEIGRSTRSDPLWCRQCEPHISMRRGLDGHLAPPWERTYEATNHEPCPHQVGVTA